MGQFANLALDGGSAQPYSPSPTPQSHYSFAANIAGPRMIAIDNLSFSYAHAPPCLQGIDLQIKPGEYLAIMGANGSGKTTFSRCLNGLLLPEKGRILVDGLDTASPEDLLPIRKRLGMVFQNPDDQLVATTVEDEIVFGLENLALPRSEMVHRLETTLASFNLTGYRHHPPHLLSGGEKQRLAIAAAVALQPRYLVLDEPTALLDPASRQDICQLLVRLRDQLGIGLIFISQFATEAAQAERLIVFHQGKIITDAAPAQVFKDAPLLRQMGLDVPFASAVAAHLQQTLGLDLGPLVSIDKLTKALVPFLPSGSPIVPVATSPKGGVAKIAAKNLHFAYNLPGGLKTGLNGANLEVPTGAILALLGPSGSGKTTLAQHLNGLLKPNRGQLLLDGTDIWQRPAELRQVRRRVGLVFQFPELQLFEETLEKDVGFGLRQLALAPDLITQRIDTALALVGLPRSSYGERPPLSLSGGERRRAALAGILAMDPDILVLDEPTAGLDPASSSQVVTLMRKLQAQGKTLVLISHDMDLVAQLATHIAVMARGRTIITAQARAALTKADFPHASGLEAPSAVRLMSALAKEGRAVQCDLVTLDQVNAHLTSSMSTEKH